jgi:hypothetical protein
MHDSKGMSQTVKCEVLSWDSPLSSERETHTPVKARFWLGCFGL